MSDKTRYSLETEQQVLADLIGTEGMLRVVGIVKQPDVFYDPKHQHIYAAMLALYKRDEGIDIITLQAELERSKKLSDAGDIAYLIKLQSMTQGVSMLEYHSRILLQMYLLRNVGSLGQSLQKLGEDPSADAIEVLDDAQRLLDDLNMQIARAEEQSWKDILKDITADVENLSGAVNGVTGIPSGLHALDEKVGGWKAGELIILAARPGMGKTAMAVKWISTALKEKKPVAVFQLEMNNVQFGKRLLAVESEYLHANHLYKHGLKNDKEWSAYHETITQTQDYPLHIIPKPGMTVFECMLESRRLKKKHDIQMVVVDYLQLMGGANQHRNSNREQEISEVSRNLKKLSLELNIPVIALSQLSRAVETRGGNSGDRHKRPMLSDLRESGSIEQDADMVMFLYRPEYYGFSELEDGTSADGVCEVINAKHRNGELGLVLVGFNDNRVKFHNLNESQQEASGFPPAPPLPNEDEEPF